MLVAEVLYIICPFCDNGNWVYNSGITDLICADIECIECWNCKKQFTVSDDKPTMRDDCNKGYKVAEECLL